MPDLLAYLLIAAGDITTPFQYLHH